ncbi:SUMF1/EgtB/PvdO family nonheme iron enzyme [Treponema sp. R80B11-R83G3]
MKKIAVLITLAFFLTAGLFAQQKYALVIGNGAYTNITKLNNPVNDANDMATALQGLGFTVEKVLNGNLSQMENGIVNLKKRLKGSKNSYGFFFYAGHGVQSNGENYLIPVDANIQSESFLRRQSISVQEMLDELNNAGNDLNVVVLDACRDNPFAWKRSGSRGLQVVGNQPADSIIVYATSAGSTASDGTGRNGLFTGHLLERLKTPGIEVAEVFRLTMGDVVRTSNSQQRPAVYNQFAGQAYLGSKPQVATTTVTTQTTQSTITQQSASISANMVRIQGGTFTMGSPTNEPGRSSNEVQHQVTVSSFYMGRYEVTQKEYKEIMETNPSDFKGDNLPVENVSWYDAVEYCNKRSQKEGLTPAYTRNGDNVTWNRGANGYRLPTEAEWEYACRAGTTTAYNTGAIINDNTGWYSTNSGYKTHPVGEKPANTWGLYDMHGNVWDWCWDWYGNYSSGSQTDPMGASSGTVRVVRGGSEGDNGAMVRSAFRFTESPYNRRGGFRLVRP